MIPVYDCSIRKENNKVFRKIKRRIGERKNESQGQCVLRVMTDILGLQRQALGWNDGN